MFGCRGAVVETGRVPCKKALHVKLVDAKTRFLACLVNVVGFPF